jgi:4-methyl-5(b-hydroxyethyl)-thiazole monophosphate biosynthesis
MIAILLADGFEEIEALTPLDVLRRMGAEVKTVSIGERTVLGAHGISVIADLTASELDLSSVRHLILPGGMPGAANLDQAEITDKLINAVLARDGVIGAICAAPLILGKRGLLEGKCAVCFPGFEDQLSGAKIINGTPAVTDGKIITAKGMGAALPFSLALAKTILGKTDVELVDFQASIMVMPSKNV